MPRHTGLRFQQWGKCSRCGFTFPLSNLTNQKGLLLDAKCIDNLDVEMRPRIIAEALADTQETTNELEQVFDDANLIEF